MKRLVPQAAIFGLLVLLFVLAASPGYADITDWESYQDPNRATVWGGSGTEYNNQYNVVYMSGSGFGTPTSGSYKVGYYDGNDALTSTDASPTLIATVLLSSYALYTDDGAAPDTWHAVVFDTTGDIPDDYNDASGDPSYVAGADDAFEVLASAIPEFPTAIAMIAVMGLCFGIYYWMRKRYHRQEVTA